MPESALNWLELIPDGVLFVDIDGQVRYANAALLELSGHNRETLVGARLDLLLPAGSRALHGDRLRRFFNAPQTRPMGRVRELSLQRADGQLLPVDISLGLVEHEGQTFALAVIRDQRELRELHARSEYLALHDGLTGLSSRHLFHELLGKAAAQAQRGEPGCALLLIDLDDFKAVNDGHGHQVGDQLLCELARRMQQALRAGDQLARLGGDEFAVLLRDADPLPAALTVADKLLQAIGRTWRCDQPDLQLELQPGASIGIAIAPHDGQDAKSLLRHADIAMYRAKEAGRGCWRVFDAAMAAQIERQTRLQLRLRRALELGGLQLHYQPQLCARSGRVLGVEALLRWRDAELGDVPPAQFIAVAERHGLIQAIGDWVLDTACAQLRAWLDQGLWLRAAVNVSVLQLRQPGFAARIGERLTRWRLDALQLELEITESAAMRDDEATRACLTQLDALGTPIVLDDFGTGYSSLGQLRQLPARRVKIDRSFVRGVPDDAQDVRLTRAVIALAKTLGLSLVAEGVETEAQRAFLTREGCDELQGWLFARALPAQGLLELLQRPPALAEDLAR